MDKTNARSSNFTAQEIELLLKLVRENQNIIENKKTDSVTAQHKEDAWQRMSAIYNNESASKRTAKVLRTKYYNLKKNMKKRAADEKRSTYATGGGPPTKKGMTDCDLKLRAILHDAQVAGLESVYDSDCINEKSDIIVYDPPLECPLDQSTKKYEICSLDAEAEKLEGPSCSWENYHPEKLKKPINEKLNNYKQIKKPTSWSKLAEVKAKWCDVKDKREIELMEEKYKSRLAYWEEKKLLERKESEFRIKLMQLKYEKEVENIEGL